MAQIRVVTTVCDVCESEESVKPYEIKQDGRQVKIDLCNAHQQTIEGLMGQGVKIPRTRRTVTKTRRSRVSSIEDVEAAKRT